jgi:hypothetical protein
MAPKVYKKTSLTVEEQRLVDVHAAAVVAMYSVAPERLSLSRPVSHEQVLDEIDVLLKAH